LESSAEFANLGGVDVLLEGGDLAIANGPYVSQLHRGGRAGLLVLPRVRPERHDGVTVGDVLLGYHGPVVADFAESDDIPFPAQ